MRIKVSSDIKIIGKINNIINSNNEINSPTILLAPTNTQPIIGEIPGTVQFFPNIALTTNIGRVYTEQGTGLQAIQLITPTIAAANLTAAVANGSFAFISNSENANEYLWVSTTNGNDSNNGSFDYPFKTITHALSVVAIGQTIIVFEGTYTESITIATNNISLIALTTPYNSPSVILAGTIIINANGFTLSGIQAQSITINGTGSNEISNCSFIPTLNNTPTIIFSVAATGNSNFLNCITSSATIQGQVQDLGTSATAIFNGLDTFVFTGATTTSTGIFTVQNANLTNLIAHGSGELSFLNCPNCIIAASTATLLSTNVLSYKNCSFAPLLSNTFNVINKTGTARCWVDSSVILPQTPLSATGIVYKDGNKGQTQVVATAPVTIANNVPAHVITLNNNSLLLAATVNINQVDGTGYVDGAEIYFSTNAGITALTLASNIPGVTFPPFLSTILSAAGGSLRLKYVASLNKFIFI